MARSCRFVVIALVSLGVLGACTALRAQPGMFGGPAPSLSMLYVPLLGTPTVQKDLKLTDDQKDKIKDARDRADAARRELFSGMRDLSDEERREKMQEVGKKMQAQMEETKKAIEDALSPDQLKRLRAVAVQIMGMAAITDKAVQKELKLSDDQTAKIKTIGEDAMKRMRDLFSSMRTLSPEERGEKMRELGAKMQESRKETEKQLGDVLNEDQKAEFEKLKGEKLEIPPGEFMVPGRGPGPGPAAAPAQPATPPPAKDADDAE
jgi:Spy/CpxP family protein refolding chaperone